VLLDPAFRGFSTVNFARACEIKEIAMLMIALSALAVAALARGALSLWRVLSAVPRSNADFDCL